MFSQPDEQFCKFISDFLLQSIAFFGNLTVLPVLTKWQGKLAVPRVVELVTVLVYYWSFSPQIYEKQHQSYFILLLHFLLFYLTVTLLCV